MTYVPHLRQLEFSIDRQLKVSIFTFLRVKGVRVQLSSFLPPQGTSLAGATHNDAFIIVYYAI